MNHQEAATLLAQQDRILILTHKRPDGDTIGCAVGLCTALREQGKAAWVLPNEDATTLFTPYLDGHLFDAQHDKPDYVVAVDIASPTLLTPAAALWWKKGIDLAIDHHPSHRDVAKRSCVDAGRAACGELVYDIIRCWGPVSVAAALPLYVAVSTDTGCFMYGNTTANTHRVAAALMDTGIDVARANKRHFRTKSLKRMRLEAMLAEEMELHDDGQIALAAIRQVDMHRLDAHEEDAEDISAFAGQLEGVRTAVTIRELEDGSCKLSVRTDHTLNATKVCTQLGGGGHAAAAGCTVQGTVEQAKAEIMRAIRTVQAENP